MEGGGGGAAKETPDEEKAEHRRDVSAIKPPMPEGEKGCGHLVRGVVSPLRRTALASAVVVLRHMGYLTDSAAAERSDGYRLASAFFL